MKNCFLQRKQKKRKKLIPNLSLILPFYSPAQASEYLGETKNTLNRWRNCGGGGPMFSQVGHAGKIAYTKEALDKWLTNQN
jgi:hypothetical protein